MGPILVRFRAVLATATGRNELVLLERDGFVEECPDERFWRFRHPDHPRREVRWCVSTRRVWEAEATR